MVSSKLLATVGSFGPASVESYGLVQPELAARQWPNWEFTPSMTPRKGRRPCWHQEQIITRGARYSKPVELVSRRSADGCGRRDRSSAITRD